MSRLHAAEGRVTWQGLTDDAGVARNHAVKFCDALLTGACHSPVWPNTDEKFSPHIASLM